MPGVWAVAIVAWTPSAVADLFHMKSGNTIEGEVLEDLGGAYRVRVAMGVVDLEKSEIVRRERRPTPWERYRKVRGRYPETAEGHFKLARWCAKQGLRGKELEHLGRVIELDPDHEKARRALGHEKVDGKWVDPRRSDRPVPRTPDDSNDPPAKEGEEDKLVREIIAKWTVKMRAIHRSRLACKACGPETERFKQGRRQVLAIRDSLAVPALTRVLSDGKVPVRLLLVEALGQFEVDEATMNLVVLALVDRSKEVRRQAASALASRDDDRVVERFRDALRSGDDRVLRRAAVALGILKARAAFEDLVDALSTKSRRRVRVTRPIFLRRVMTAFGGTRTVTVGSQRLRYRPRSIGVLSRNVMMMTEDSTETRIVDVYRTEVQEALIAITGRNFGFDRDAWLDWWRAAGG